MITKDESSLPVKSGSDGCLKKKKHLPLAQPRRHSLEVTDGVRPKLGLGLYLCSGGKEVQGAAGTSDHRLHEPIPENISYQIVPPRTDKYELLSTVSVGEHMMQGEMEV